MRNFIAGTLLITIVAACDQATLTESVLDTPTRNYTVNGGPGASSTGHYEVDFGDNFIEQYSYSAILKPNGASSGQWQLHGSDATGRIYALHGETTCINVLTDGKTARVGGVIKKATGLPTIEPGMEAVWIVQDNGEGKKSAPDLASDIRFGYPQGSGAAQFNCDEGLPQVSLVRLTGKGNIQVRP